MAVRAFDAKPFLALIKKTCKNISYYDTHGREVDRDEFVASVDNFNEDELDCDLSTLGKSSVPPAEPAKRQPDSSAATPLALLSTPDAASSSRGKRPRTN